MESRKEGRNYLIRMEEKDLPVRLNRNKTDTVIRKLHRLVSEMRDVLKALSESGNWDLEYLLNQEVFRSCGLELEDGRCWQLDRLEDTLSELSGFLETHDDPIPPKEEVLTLKDLGFQNHFAIHSDSHPYLFEKELEDSPELLVTEEVLLYRDDTPPIRRIRTIVMEPCEGGRRSTKISYRKKPLTKQLERAIANTRDELKAKK